MLSINRFSALVCFSITISACSPALEVERAVSLRTEGGSEELFRPLIGRPMNGRDERLLLSREVPEFSGVYVAANGVVVVRVTDSAAARVESHRLRLEGFVRRLASTSQGATPPIRLELADASYATLDSIMHSLMGGPLRDSRAWGYRVDEMAGRVLLSFVSAADEGEARARIPSGLRQFVETEVTGPVDALQSLTLHSRRRPLANAFQFSAKSGATCTMGFMVYLGRLEQPSVPDPSRGRYMLTASHCTERLMEFDGGIAIQPAAPGSAQIGREVLDAQRFYSTPGVPVWCALQNDSGTQAGCICPAGQVCSHGDVALIQLDDSVGFEYGWQTVSWTVNNGASAPGFRWLEAMSQIRAWPTVGITVTKVGQRTGWTVGTVRSSCTYVGPYFSLLHSAETPAQMCQVEVNGRAGGGDSGSPVWGRFSSDSRPTPLGILHFGVLADPATQLSDRYIFTPIQQAELALGVHLNVN